jgi:Flp pilus assembly protein TadD
MTNNLLEQAISAARDGRRDEARTALTQVVQADERNEEAWVWLAGMVDDPEDTRTCLENALHLNPSNTKARQGLDWVEQHHGPRMAEAVAVMDAPLASTPDTAIATPPAVARPVGPPLAEPGEAYDLAREADHPCPYCGAPNLLEQRSCAKCRNDLRIRSAARATRSVPLTILGILWMISGVLQALGGLASTALGLIAFSTFQAQAQRYSKTGVPFPTTLLLPLVVGLVAGGITITIGRGLLRRERWAYIVLLVLTTLNIVASVGMFLLGALSARGLAQILSDPRLTPAGAENLGRTTGPLLTILLVVLGFQLLYVLLVGLSYRDFWGRMVRFQPALDDGDHGAHYNSGVIYKNRGMWYMAAQEWNAANKMKPRDASCLHALGLAYLQLKQFDLARTTLDSALQVAPADARIADSRALVDRVEQNKR